MRYVLFTEFVKKNNVKWQQEYANNFFCQVHNYGN